jgi:polar amino acid transport system substrate-binding protein
VTATDKDDTFENMLTGVQGGKYPWMVAADITPEREQAFDFAYLYDDFATFVGRAGGPDLSSTDLLSTCGYTISALASSTQAQELHSISQKCTASGKKPITIKEYKDVATTELSLKSGQDDFIAMYISQEIKADPALKITGPTINRNREGIITQKGNGVAQVVADAINAMMADGTYKQILSKYYTDDHLITHSTVNPAPYSGE